MDKFNLNLENWPCGFTGEPIMSSTDDALIYAQLIYNLPDKQDQLFANRKAINKTCIFLLDQENPDFNLCSALATKGQFFRECLEECERIKKEAE